MLKKNQQKALPANILIADAGATNVKWIMIQNGARDQAAKTMGFNVHQQPITHLNSSINELPKVMTRHRFREIHFYGAGITADKKKAEVANCLAAHFEVENIEVRSDLLAAARALFHSTSGIACILGTGSNSCFYDGNDIIDRIPSLGYAIGDEGSGASLGKQLILHYLRKQMPKDLKIAFEEQFSISESLILSRVYQSTQPARFLAQFALFLKDKTSHPWIEDILHCEISKFFDEIILQYKEVHENRISFCGSIAYHYQDTIRAVAKLKNLEIGQVLAVPGEYLARYHRRSLEKT